MIERIIGVLRLDVNTYEEIEADPNATNEAAIIVAAVALLSGLGAGLGGGGFFRPFLMTVIWTFVGWFLWAAVSLWVGTNLFGGRSDLGRMLRVIGYARVPGILGIIPCVGALIGFLWSLVTGFVAIRQGLDLDDTKAFLTILIGFIVYVGGQMLLGLIFGSFSLLF